MPQQETPRTDSPPTKRRNTAEPSAGIKAPNLVSGVSAENYATLGRAFIGLCGGGFVIARHDIPGHNLKATPRQWGAWRGYLDRIGYRLGLMDRMGYYTVPAEWPHLFDAGATIAHDYEAADDWTDTQARERAKERQFATDGVMRKAAVKKHWGLPRKGTGYQAKPDPTWQPTIDVDLLMESHAIDTAVAADRTMKRAAAKGAA